jgi:hypothetical protein
MKLHGTIVENLESALQSARRHRGKPLYADTVTYWIDLLGYSRASLDMTPHPDTVRRLIAALEIELADRADGASVPRRSNDASS